MSQDKMVVFVGGTSYSGSTLCDMILANDPAGLSCGEVYAIFHPYRPHHLRLNALDSAVDWSAIRRSGANNLYSELFAQFPDANFIVDSSKSPLWIAERTAYLESIGIRTRNLLIWKTPQEFRASRRKRGRERGWQREWINYHRYYFTMVTRWHGVSYRDFVTRPETLERVCAVLGIRYFSEKRDYWDKEHLTVFGNDTTKIHLHDKSTAGYAQIQRTIESDIAQSNLPAHRSVSYIPAAERDELARPICSAQIDKILAILLRSADRLSVEGTMPSSSDEAIQELRFGTFYRLYQMAKLKYGLGWLVSALRQRL